MADRPLLPETGPLRRAVQAHLIDLFGIAPDFQLFFAAERWLVAYKDPTALPEAPAASREVLAQIRLDPANDSGLVFDVL